MKKIILASTSPRRYELLRQIGLEFRVVASDYEEDMNLDMTPEKLARSLSANKASAVAERFPNHIIIGADTFVVFQGKLLGKPVDKKDAKKMLKIIGGKQVSIITGLTVLDATSKKKVSKVVEAKVYITKMSDAEIDAYIGTGEPLDKAGAFAVQGIGAIFIKRIEGDFSSVVGLPLFELGKILKKFGIKVI